MPVHLIPSFLFFCYVNMITPGPANLCSLFAALNYGKINALRQWRGLFAGFTVISILSVFMIYFIGNIMGDYVHLLSYIGAAYLFWIVVQTVRSKEISSEHSETKSCNFSLLMVGCFLPFTGPICNLVWLYIGTKLQSAFQRHRGLLNWIMAAALAGCGIRLLIG